MSQNDEQLLLEELQKDMLRALRLNSERGLEDLENALLVNDLEASEIVDDNFDAVYRRRIADEEELFTKAPRMAAFWGVAPATCRDLQQTLARYPDLSVLQYFVCEERLIIFRTTAQGTHAVHSPISKQTLTELVQRYRQLVAFRGNESIASLESLPADILLRDVANQLYQAVISPVEHSLPAGACLCVIPHGVLHYLPLNTLLTNDGSYLIEKYKVFYAVSRSLFDWCHNKTIGMNRQLTVFANPRIGNWDGNLPLAEEQARNLASEHPDIRLFTGSEASKEAFWQYAPKAGVLSLDVHNVFNHERPLLTALRLADTGSGDGGALTVRELYQRGRGVMRGRLVVAAVCDGNVGEDATAGAEDELTTLARALHYAGFSTVITSLWRVHELSAWLLLEMFYEDLLASPGADALKAGDALHRAQTSLARMSGQEILVRCRRQCDLANQEDVSGLRGAWIELSAVAWVEVHCHNFDAARRAYEKARAVFAGAAAEYDELLAVIDHDLPLLEDLSRSAQQLPAYDECLFDHPYYWGAFVLLGRWNC